MIFVFGSNLAGIHDSKTAKHAVEFYGAKEGRAIGPYNRSYAIPERDYNNEPLSVKQIRPYVDQFLEFAEHHNHREFMISKISDNLNLAILFESVADNCMFDDAWRPILGEYRNYFYI